MAKYKILLVGCGQLGNRHLQAVASLKDIAEIHVVDPNPASIELGKLRLKEISGSNQNIKFYWHDEFHESSARGDLCIVSTQAKGRCALVKQIAGELGFRTFLIEKIVSQSVDEYRDLMSFSEENGLSVWVNCKTRAYAVHKYIKSKLDPNEPFIYSRISGNDGLANNGVHTADLFVFYDDAARINSSGSRIDLVLHPSKRGQENFDLSGTLHGYTEKGSDFTMSFASNHMSPDHISIVSPRGRFIIDHMQKFVFESSPESDWQWKRIPVEENWRVSHMTKSFATDILRKGTCDLPTLAQCYPAHEYILSELLPYFNKLLGKNHEFCPVT